MNPINLQRRKWLSLGGIVLGASLLPQQVLASLSTVTPLALRFRQYQYRRYPHGQVQW